MAFPIVGIAASAGGLEAITELLAALPAKTGLAYIVVQHLDPEHPSHLPELLRRRVQMSVEQARDDLEVRADHVYVIPPNASLTLRDERLHLVPREAGPHHPADLLFNSLADERGDAAIAVVLSGGDADGALGIQAIKDRGGIVLAQTPATAKFAGMPQHAIATGCVDLVLRPREIAAELVRLRGHPYLRAVPEADARAENPDAPDDKDTESLRRIFRRLRNTHGVDFSLYKSSTIQRRLARRMALQKTQQVSDYLSFIDANPEELAALYQDFLIRVTGFFRDPESLDDLAKQILPNVWDAGAHKAGIRIWVPGCATGEEVYSIAIVLMEYLEERLPPGGIQIFGTDVSEAAVQKARNGVYLDNIAQQVSAERLRRFFVKANDEYRIAKGIRDLCIFARQDVTRDPPFSRVDLISCRNLLIYLDAKAQRRVMQSFHYALRPHGFLMLGPSESVGLASDLFEVFGEVHRVYKRRATPEHTTEPAHFAAPNLRDDGAIADASRELGAESIERESDRVLLMRYAPASVLVDDALNILQFRGETGPFLEHASGAPSLNLRRTVRPELLVELMAAVLEARTTGTDVRREGLWLGEQEVTFTIIPLGSSRGEPCYVIVFEDASSPPRRRVLEAATRASVPESEKDRHIERLARENIAIRNHLQAVTEEHDAAKEELKSAHEEVLSANE
jgi:two-component system CheB/CheR fusion protein